MSPNDALALAANPQTSPGAAGGQGRRVSLFVPGRARPQGSKRAIGRVVPGVRTRTGRPVVAVTMQESSEDLGDWRARVAHFALMAWGSAGPTAAPVRVTALFIFRRAKSHYSKAKRSFGKLAKHAPAYPTAKTMGDLEKLERALYDALTGAVLIDDGQVVSNHNDKVWGARDEPEGVHITIEEIVA